jgi:glycosyltransferase involved in cell wall biosynthesis
LRQESVAFDLIISDDASDDDTLDVVRAIAGERAQIIVSSERLGLAGNWNRCITLCSTPFISVVHQDDLLCPGHLARHLEAFGKDHRIGLVASDWETIDSHGRAGPDPGRLGDLGRVPKVLLPGDLAQHWACHGNPFRCSAVSIRTAAHVDVGGFSERYRYALDIEFWLRVSRTWKVMWIPEQTAKFRFHNSSETSNLFAKDRDSLFLFGERKNLAEEVLTHDLGGHPLLATFRRELDRRLIKELLSRFHSALWEGRVELANECFRKALRQSPSVLYPLLINDYRLAIKMGILALSPRIAGRLFSHRANTG